MRTTVGERGQITIPKPLRDSLGIRAGDELEVGEEGGRLVLRKAAVTARLERVFGTVDLGMSTDEFIDLLRGPAELPPDRGRP
jgi:antitoxin PrlF